MSQLIVPHPASRDAGAGLAVDQLDTLLVTGEALTACALQHRLYALAHRRSVAAATTGRFIYLARPLLGGFEPTSVRWQDLREVRFTVGMISARLEIDYSANLSDTAIGEGDTRTLVASGLERQSAQALYRACQAQEQAWREKRRIRSLEELRTQSGGVQIATGVYPGAERASVIESAASPAGSPAGRLAQARQMLSQGLISDAEYEAVKAKIVSGL